MRAATASGYRRRMSLRCPPALRIAPATATDLAALVALERAAFGADAYSAAALRALAAVGSGGAGTEAAAAGPAGDTVVLVALAGRQLLGYGIVQLRATAEFARSYGVAAAALAAWIGSPPAIGYLKSIAVDPGCRRRGVGRALVAARLQVLRGRGARDALLWQMPGRDLEAFHAACGFRRLPVEGALRYAQGGAASLWHRCLAPADGGGGG